MIPLRETAASTGFAQFDDLKIHTGKKHDLEPIAFVEKPALSRIHADRTADSNRDHRHSRSYSDSGRRLCARECASCSMRFESSPDRPGDPYLCKRTWRPDTDAPAPRLRHERHESDVSIHNLGTNRLRS